MRIITLISDWQNDDFYTASIKGLLYSKCADINVIDITNKIDSYKYTQAAFILRNAFLHFPVGTIHIVAVNSDIDKNHVPICIEMEGHYFIGTQSGIFSLMFSEKPSKIIQIKESGDLTVSTFSELSLFAKAAVVLANGGKIEDLGKKIGGEIRPMQFMPAFDEFIITGNVIYVDSYQNVFTNITKTFFEEIRKGRDFVVTIKSDSYSINKLSKNYSEVEVGEMIALFNSLELLEISQRNGRLAELLDIRLNSPVTIKFK